MFEEDTETQIPEDQHLEDLTAFISQAQVQAV